MDCSEKTDLQGKCEAAWIAFADYAAGFGNLTTPGNRFTSLMVPMADFFRKSSAYAKARNAYTTAVRTLEQHLVRHRC
jgi:hypothetical protein